MTADSVATVLDALGRLEQKVDGKADKSDIARLEAKVDKTNGRVTELEKREIVHTAADGLKRTIWKAALAIVTAVAALSAIAEAIIDHV
jgi:hypothetical protein